VAEQFPVVPPAAYTTARLVLAAWDRFAEENRRACGTRRMASQILPHSQAIVSALERHSKCRKPAVEFQLFQYLADKFNGLLAADWL